MIIIYNSRVVMTRNFQPRIEMYDRNVSGCKIDDHWAPTLLPKSAQPISKCWLIKLLKTSVTRCWNRNTPNVSKSCPKSSHSRFYLKVMYFKMAPKVTKYFGHFCIKLCRQELLKIAQSGHSA